MRTPKITNTENQIITSRRGIESFTLTRDHVIDLVEEFHGDAEIIAICYDGAPTAAYVRLEGWSETQTSWARFWIWITTDKTEYSLVMTTPGL